MGHERVGFLPKTKKWTDLVKQMGSVYSSGVPVATVAAHTLDNIRKRYETLSKDDAFRTAFSFLVAFSRACRSQDPSHQLHASGIPIADNTILRGRLVQRPHTRQAAGREGSGRIRRACLWQVTRRTAQGRGSEMSDPLPTVFLCSRATRPSDVPQDAKVVSLT